MGSVQKYRYRVVDVFTNQPLAGNALALFPEASGIDAAFTVTGGRTGAMSDSISGVKGHFRQDSKQSFSITGGGGRG